ncbi:MAG: hypothetical protein VR69_00250 [Peptococcaceae bacterium BRH_c4b]|nr:MAG: hypothetical protein VR69_00250 [Peptococcaceae bacterium BRH_c4b]
MDDAAWAEYVLEELEKASPEKREMLITTINYLAAKSKGDVEQAQALLFLLPKWVRQVIKMVSTQSCNTR